MDLVQGWWVHLQSFRRRGSFGKVFVYRLVEGLAQVWPKDRREVLETRVGGSTHTCPFFMGLSLGHQVRTTGWSDFGARAV